MEPSNFPKYPEIVLLPRRPEIMAVREVIATEKLHGSSFRVRFPAGMTSIDDIRYGSREMEHTEDKFPLRNAVAWFQSRPILLATMWETIKSYGFPDATVFAEAYGPGIKSKGVRYSNGQDVLVRAFDVMVGENFVTYDLIVELTSKMCLPIVPEVWRGSPSVEAFDALLEKPSAEAAYNGVVDEKNLAEGVVIRSNPLLRNVFGEWLIVKHKAKKFAEVSNVPTVRLPREATPADVFAASHVTDGRVANAVGRLRDRGVVLRGDMTDVPMLLAEIVADVRKEHGWPDGVTDKQALGAASKVFAPIYRRMLAGGEI